MKWKTSRKIVSKSCTKFLVFPDASLVLPSNLPIHLLPLLVADGTYCSHYYADGREKTNYFQSNSANGTGTDEGIERVKKISSEFQSKKSFPFSISKREK